MKLIDTHAHLDFRQYDGDREEVIAACREKLHAVVNPGTSRETVERVLALADEHPDFIFPAVGFHPSYIEGVRNEEISALLETAKQVERDLAAIGEIGMDFHHVKEKALREQQRDVFEKFLTLAEHLDKSVIIHSRDAEKHCLDALERYDVTGVMHCFNGTIKRAERAIDRGFAIGVSTQVLYAKGVRKLVKEIPIESIVLETDAPFLYQGERNHPVYVHESARTLADLKEMDIEDVVAHTNENARQVFPLIAQREEES